MTQEIAQIEAQTFSRPWSRASIEAEIADETAVFLVCMCDRRVIGYISAKVLCPECYIGNLAVQAGYRRQGVGAALLEEVIDSAKQIGCAFVSLEVRLSNHSAISLYERFGFQIQGIRKNYYSAPNEDAAIYTLYFEEQVSP